MAMLKCKMCGGNINVCENQNIGICDSCGSTMTLPQVNDDYIKKTAQPIATDTNSITKAFNSEALLKRAFMLLEDAEWQRADDILEQVLNYEPENAMVYVGKLMIDIKVNKKENLGNRAVDFSDNTNYQKAVRFGNGELRQNLELYKNGALQRMEYVKAEKIQQAKDISIRLKQQQEQFKQQKKINDECLKTIKDNDKAINQRRILFIILAFVMGFVSVLMMTVFDDMSSFTFTVKIMCLYFCLVIIFWCWLVGDKDRKNIDIFKNNNELKKAEQLSTEYKKKMIPLLTRWGLILNIIVAVFLALTFIHYLIYY